MRVPLNLRILAAVAGVNARDFANGWAEGVFRWGLQDTAGRVPLNPLPLGSVRRAASAAAVAFMRELK